MNEGPALRSSPFLSAGGRGGGDMFQDPQWIPGTVGSIKRYKHSVFSYMDIPGVTLNV